MTRLSDGGWKNSVWQKKVYNREDWKKLLRTARNRSARANGMNE
jgi:hypothetical protein